uniref:Uncharacterized protein n=1 Tax=Haptolina brevifila TaxID=156173 RepID=A0A7S2G433_9EUKA|mmetsp:Transcript_25420/g.51083  ORF Transcript_25420/g.51083 Transcript_25420/m.51083 type:complete len:104 (+) Transcript_25420:190-501(+)
MSAELHALTHVHMGRPHRCAHAQKAKLEVEAPFLGERDTCCSRSGAARARPTISSLPYPLIATSSHLIIVISSYLITIVTAAHLTGQFRLLSWQLPPPPISSQ